MSLIFVLISGLVILYLLLHEGKIDSYLSRKQSFKVFLILGISVITGFILNGVNLTAKWSAVDDHEIAWFLGPQGSFSLFDVPQKLMETEIGKVGVYPRFRPGYYLLRILETFVWGDNPFLWYFTSLLLFAFSYALFWYFLQNFVGLISAFIITLFTLAFTYWSDIWARLGPGEIYAVPGLAIFTFSYYKMIVLSNKTSGNNYKFYCFGLSVGSFLTIGSKENFVLLALPLLILAIVLFLRKKLTNFSIAAITLSLIYSFWIGLSLFITLSSTSKDQYLNDATIQSRTAVLFQVFVNTLPIIFITLLVLGLFQASIYLYLYQTKRMSRSREINRNLRNFGLVLAVLLLVYLSQGTFYNGNWPTGIRYDFPGMLVWPLLFFFSFLYISRILRLLEFPAVFISRLKIVIFLGLFLVVAQIGFWPLILAGITNSARTNIYTQNIEVVAEKLKANPSLPVVFESHSPYDFEPLLATKRFLALKGVTNELYIRAHEAAALPDLKTALDKSVEGRIIGYSLNGGSGEFTGFKSLKELKSESSCLSIGFSGDLHDNCTFVLEVWHQ